jgi:hypothetical protein
MTEPQIHNEIYKEISKQIANNKCCKNLDDNSKIIMLNPNGNYGRPIYRH